MATTPITFSTKENLFISSAEEQEKLKNAAAQKERVTKDEFLQLLTTQLTHQDPLNPMDDTAFLSQMAQLQALDEQIEMTNALNSFHLDSSIKAATQMIGMEIMGVDDVGKDASGLVRSAVVRDGKTYLVLENLQRVPFEQITEVHDPVYEQMAG